MAFKIKAIIVIIFLFGMLNSCRQTRSFDNKNDRALKKYIIDNQYIINPQNGECYGYIDSILYCKNLPSEMLLVYTSKLTGENIYSHYNIIILKENGIIHVPCLKIYGIHEQEGNVLFIEDSATLAGSTSWGTHIFYFDKEIVHDYSYIVDSLKDGASAKTKTE